ncbi:winged helix-turn-helix domain-containing protein [Burkholderia multivorans]|uniref:winged helix-turn-helix domain-containing protein n=1 Tax=Burkholderia multivorans TaxID=87883 RepID=UPI001C24133C|nr:winged helix-turn-helix domain-containing protein [Burkholderia multivorans]MBU9405988.1 winged helix-turn-helix domain-containing protein [Burkholderia multivorans]MBU9502922.1 winged helix-turn-helix domain-containing protein [Burkholderia multivorans]MCA8249160.1 winged helix-turn-helix domain-containing protein [Burkholderia multivorans]MCA8461295.1 winged helix-turn-helix domain-containing protein [Burkholderia multivorans]MDN8013564.1 winged helix-turn-helix domain-containing protein 
MEVGKVGPISKQIIECVIAHPGIHAGEVARKLGLSQGGGPRQTIRNLIAAGYLVRGEKMAGAGSKGHAAAPLRYTGKPFTLGHDGSGSTRWSRIQQRIANEMEKDRRSMESIEWAGKAIRAMVDVGRVAV